MLKLLITATIFITSIYSLSFTDIDGNSQSFGTYQGKKILLVNIATNADEVGQLTQLQQLHQQYQDSLVVIGFPSNSFNNEPRTNTEIKQFCQNNYGVTFKLAAKGNVTGAGMLPIYNWLAQQSENGVLNGTIVGDFQKFLIDKNGQIIGVFAPSVSPMDSTVIQAITEN